MSSGAELIAELTARGLRHDSTEVEALTDRLDDAPVTLYCGFDPTADSLHIGNLQSIMLLRRFQLAGHAPIALVGGATGMIGDPSGRSSERQFLDVEELDRNRECIGAQLGTFLDFDAGPGSARLVDNRTWTQDMGVLEFLRDVGKYVTINTMLAATRSRAAWAGISYTEFSYMLLQATTSSRCTVTTAATSRSPGRTSGATSPRSTWCGAGPATWCTGGRRRSSLGPTARSSARARGRTSGSRRSGPAPTGCTSSS
jgi:tyrosyl-tRNA synthetase